MHTNVSTANTLFKHYLPRISCLKMALSAVILVVCVFECAVIGALASDASHGKSEFDQMNSPGIMDVSDFSVYYDVQTNQTIKKMMPRPWYSAGWMLRLPFFGGPCKCEALRCTCCAGIKIDRYKFNRKACSVLTYEPADAMLMMEMTINDEKIYKNRFSAKNPPPFCVPMPIPYLPPGFVDMCVRLFDITIVDQKLHVCMDWDTRIDKAPVLVLHYDCMDMGLGGVSLSKPSNSTAAQSNVSPTEPEQVDSDIFDPVNEDTTKSTPYPFGNAVKYI